MPDYFRSGAEFAINTAGVGEQNFPRLAYLPNGNFIVVWQTADSAQDGSGGAIKAQIFAPDGSKIGSEFLVNNLLGSTQDMADISVLENGTFVITWHTIDATQDGNSGAIKARAFDANGTPLGNEFLVNTVFTGNQYRPEITSLVGGGYVITWVDANTNVGDVKGQMFSATGVKIGAEFLVNNSTASMQSGHTITSLANGGFALAWSTGDIAADGSSSAVRMRIFGPSGSAIASEFTANNLTANAQGSPDIKQLSNGNILVTWVSYDPAQDGQGLAIKARIFSASGTAIGSEFLVNNLGTGDQDRPNIAVLADGGFMITWSTTDVAQDGNGSAIKARVFDPDGVPVAPEFLINGLATGNQTLPQIVQLPDGRVFATWVSASGDGSNLAIRGQFLASNAAPSITSNGGGETAAISVGENLASITIVAATGSNISYEIVGGADAALFTINAVTGALSFVNAPNFEIPGDVDANNMYDVVVRATDGSQSDTQAIAVTVTNIDEAPVMPASASTSVVEGDTAVATLLASDPEGNTLSYVISGGADAALFAIDAVTGALSFVAGRDFEAPSDAGADNVYNVIVTASDGVNSTTQSLTVIVTDQNEAPVITATGALSVIENSMAVTTVTAADVDGPAISFAIAGGADAALFTIDPVTGVLSFIAAPDFEAAGDANGDNVYDVIVAASDGSLIDTQALAITVTNANEAVSITSNGGDASSAIALTENSTAVTIVTASDLDGDAISYSIAGGADAALFTIDGVTGELSFANLTDFEAPADSNSDNIYDIIVAASDGSIVDLQSLLITVADLNEAPVLPASISATVVENGTAVTTIAAVDTEGGALAYAIAGGADAALFAIDAATGALSFIAASDFESPIDVGANNVYDVVISVNDGTNLVTQTLAIAVTDANEAPIITSNGGGATAAVSMAENALAVTTLTSSDPEGSPRSYSIVGGADAMRFSINATTGVLAFINAPNFEAADDADANNVYDVIVQASDGVLTDMQALAVTITNVNESPLITSNGGGATAAITMNENTNAVTSVSSTDEDGPALTYSIIGGADASRFTINATTGALSFVSAPNFEAPTDAGANNIYDVIVQASDGTLTDTQAIAVTINNIVDGSTINGSNSANTLTGTNAEDTINGLGGNDTITGGLGADRLTGGTGADRFTYTATNQSLVGAMDVITDFTRSQNDRIVLSGIDANVNTTNDQAFTFIGTAAFSNVAGQLRYQQISGNTFISGDVNGDGVADFMIQVNGNITFQSGDFIL
jgi:hypothetical protein